MKETANRGKGKRCTACMQWAVLAVFVVFSIGGQLIPKMAVGEQFPVMRVSSTIAAAATLVLIGLILLLYRNADQRIRRL